MAQVQNPWFVTHRPRSNAKLRLYCFPYAGGGSAVYHAWSGLLPPEVEICAVCPPGRERRIAEPPYQSLPELVAGLAAALGADAQVPFAFFGYSVGATVAYELARTLRRAGGPLPKQLWVAARMAPHLPPRRKPIHHLPDDEFRREVAKLEGTPAEVLASSSLMDFLLPLLRADFMVAETYVHKAEAPLPVSLTAWGGSQDAHVLHADLEAWSKHGASTFAVEQFPGGHFFIHSAQGRVLEHLRSDLLGLLEATQ